MIAKITRAYVRHYRDNGQTTAYVEWVDHKGETGRTEGKVLLPGNTKAPLAAVCGMHMGSLLARAICHGVEIEREAW